MSSDDASVRRWFVRIVGGLTYMLLGILILGFRLGPDLLGYRGAFAADMAEAAFPALMILWFLVFPFLLLVGYLIGIALSFVGILEDEIKLR